MNKKALRRERNIFVLGNVGVVLGSVVLAWLIVQLNASLFGGKDAPIHFSGRALELISKIAFFYFALRLSLFLRLRWWLTAIFAVSALLGWFYVPAFVGLLVALWLAYRKAGPSMQELRIDFYSKTEVAIQLDFPEQLAFSEPHPFPANETGELFLFACYALRQLFNLGNHVVAKVLALLLAGYTDNTALELANGTYEFPTETGLALLMGIQGMRFDVNYEVLRNQIFCPVPKHVEFKGNGKKAFYVSLPPLYLATKGFGHLGFQVNFYAFHSVIALFSYLAATHINDEAYLTHLAAVAQGCGKAYIAGGGIPLVNLLRLADAILKQVEVMP